MPGPLSGVRVLDLTGVVSGPIATMLLADQGADVLKIEPIGGDITRRSRAQIGTTNEFSALFISSNRGKRSLAIDIKHASGREVLARLAAQADVLVQNFRPGTMERLGLGPSELCERYPRLIYVSISGVGETGPYVQYTAVRASRVLGKLAERGEALPDFQAELSAEAMARQLQSEDFWQMLLAASKADAAVETAVAAGEPAHVARYAFQLAQTFSNFYEKFPIIHEENREKKVFLLWMTDFFRRQLERTAGILGIEIPAYM